MATKGEKTRRRIVREAARVFNRKGYAGASIYDVMEAADIKKGGLYGHFSGKDEIVLEAFSHAARREEQRMRQAVDEAETAPDKLIALVQTFEPLATGDGGGCPVLNTAIEVDDDDTRPELRRRVRTVLKKWRHLIRSIVRDGIRKGDLRPHVDPDVVASLLISTIEGAVMMSRAEEDPVHVERAIDLLTWYVRSELA
jgi:AcrR family transcriptional regulator